MEKSSESIRTYEDFEPVTAWLPDATYDTFTVHLPGFRKDQLRVQVTTGGKLKVSGERLTEKDKWSRFRLETPIAFRYDPDKISALFENNMLYIKHPKVNKLAAEAPKTESEINRKPQNNGQEQRQAAQTAAPDIEKQQSQKPKQELQAAMMKKEEKASEEAPPTKKNDAESVPGKSLEKKNEEVGGATMEKKKNTVGEKMEETSNVRDKSGAVEDSKKGLGVLVREMKHSRKIMILIVAILFVLVVIYARNLVRSIGKSQD